MSKEKKKSKPMFKTVEMMAEISGIGENTLRNLVNSKQIDYIQIGNRRLLTEDAIWQWYERTKVAALKEVM